MKTSDDFERSLRAQYHIQSDYSLAKLLGITRSAMSQHKTGRSKVFSDETGYRIAELLGYPPEYVLSCLAGERAGKPETRKVWENIARKFARSTRRAAAALLIPVLAVMLTLGSAGEARAATGQPRLFDISNIHYATRRWRRWLAALLLALGTPIAYAADYVGIGLGNCHHEADFPGPVHGADSEDAICGGALIGWRAGALDIEARYQHLGTYWIRSGSAENTATVQSLGVQAVYTRAGLYASAGLEAWQTHFTFDGSPETATGAGAVLDLGAQFNAGASRVRIGIAQHLGVYDERFNDKPGVTRLHMTLLF